MTDKRKEAFDAARAADADGSLDQDDVNKINAALDMLLETRITPDAPSAPERDFTPAKTSGDGIVLIQRFEGFADDIGEGKVKAYPDPGTGGDPWTIGWGSTGADPFNGGRIRRGTIWTHGQANKHFRKSLVTYEQDVISALGDAIQNTSQAQFDALVSFHYNTGKIRKATLTRKHVAGDFAGAEREFARWVYAGGKVMNGLVRRRQAEAALYRSGL